MASSSPLTPHPSGAPFDRAPALASLGRTWDFVRPYRSDLWGAINTAVTGDAADGDIEGILWNLRTWPLELVDWPVHNSNRTDIRFNPGINRFMQVQWEPQWAAGCACCFFCLNVCDHNRRAPTLSVSCLPMSATNCAGTPTRMAWMVAAACRKVTLEPGSCLTGWHGTTRSSCERAATQRDRERVRGVQTRHDQKRNFFSLFLVLDHTAETTLFCAFDLLPWRLESRHTRFPHHCHHMAQQP